MLEKNPSETVNHVSSLVIRPFFSPDIDGRERAMGRNCSKSMHMRLGIGSRFHCSFSLLLMHRITRFTQLYRAQTFARALCSAHSLTRITEGPLEKDARSSKNYTICISPVSPTSCESFPGVLFLIPAFRPRPLID